MRRSWQRVYNAPLKKAAGFALIEIEKMVRRHLRKRNAARYFCMGMGTYAFYDKYDCPIGIKRSSGHFDPDECHCKELQEFMDEFCELKLDGIPFRIDGPDAPVRHNW